MERVRAEVVNIRGALQWFYWLAEAGRTMDISVQALLDRQQTLPPVLRGYALIVTGRQAWFRGEYDRAQMLLEESVAGCQDAGDQAAYAEALHYLADVRSDQGAYAAAGAYYTQSLALYQGLGNTHGSAWVQHSLAEMALWQGDSARAIGLEQASLALFRDIGDTVGIILSLLNQGFAAQQQGDDQHAARRFRESLALARPQESIEGMLLGLVGLAGAAARQHAARAVQILGAVETLVKDKGAGCPMRTNENMSGSSP